MKKSLLFSAVFSVVIVSQLMAAPIATTGDSRICNPHHGLAPFDSSADSRYAAEFPGAGYIPTGSSSCAGRKRGASELETTSKNLTDRAATSTPARAETPSTLVLAAALTNTQLGDQSPLKKFCKARPTESDNEDESSSEEEDSASSQAARVATSSAATKLVK